MDSRKCNTASIIHFHILLSKDFRELGVISQACNLSTQVAEAGGLMQVVGQLRLSSKTCLRQDKTLDGHTLYFPILGNIAYGA